MMPISTADTLNMPRAKNFRASVTTITSSAADQFSNEPYSGVPIDSGPPAAY